MQTNGPLCSLHVSTLVASLKLNFRKSAGFTCLTKSTRCRFVQIETFDPHEPFFSQEEFKALCMSRHALRLCTTWLTYGAYTCGRTVQTRTTTMDQNSIGLLTVRFERMMRQ